MYNSILWYILLLLCIAVVHCVDVEIPQGRLSGDIRTNIDGGTYYIFKSIPYAKPPLGELRFKVSVIVLYVFIINLKILQNN